MSSVEFSEKSGIPLQIVEGVLKGTQNITQEVAQRLCTYWDVSVEFWLGIQKQYDNDIMMDLLTELSHCVHAHYENLQKNHGREKEDFQDIKKHIIHCNTFDMCRLSFHLRIVVLPDVI